jgi:hypothetical protein
VEKGAADEHPSMGIATVIRPQEELLGLSNLIHAETFRSGQS